MTGGLLHPGGRLTGRAGCCSPCALYRGMGQQGRRRGLAAAAAIGTHATNMAARTAPGSTRNATSLRFDRALLCRQPSDADYAPSAYLTSQGTTISAMICVCLLRAFNGIKERDATVAVPAQTGPRRRERSMRRRAGVCVGSTPFTAPLDATGKSSVTKGSRQWLLVAGCWPAVPSFRGTVVPGRCPISRHS